MGPVQHRQLIRFLSFFVALDLAAGVVALYARGGEASAAASGARSSRAAEARKDDGILAGGNFRHRRGSETSSTGATAPGPAEAATSPSTTIPPPSSSTTGPAATSSTGRPTTSSSGPATSSTTPPSTGPRTTTSGGGTSGSSAGAQGPSGGGAASGGSQAGSQAGSVVVDDPAGDTTVDGTDKVKPDGRADIVRSRATTSAGNVSLSVQVGQPVDPKNDPRWNSDSTFITWEIDTNGDGAQDYEIQYFLEDDSYSGTVGRPADAEGEPVCDAVAAYGADGYILTFESGCLGDPASFSYRVSIYYDTDPEDENADVLYDVTPNGGLSRPVKRP